jgi:hypothetical protein
MELNDFIAAVAVGIATGFGMIVLYAWYLYRDLKNRVDRMIQEVIAEHEANMVGLDIETDNGVYFCYNSKDKQFICQGATVGEIAVAFRERYPTKTAYLAGGDPVVVSKFREELQKMRLEVANENSPGQ